MHIYIYIYTHVYIYIYIYYSTCIYIYIYYNNNAAVALVYVGGGGLTNIVMAFARRGKQSNHAYRHIEQLLDILAVSTLAQDD